MRWSRRAGSATAVVASLALVLAGAPSPAAGQVPPLPTLLVGVVSGTDTGLGIAGVCVQLVASGGSDLGDIVGQSTTTLPGGLYVLPYPTRPGNPRGVFIRASDCNPLPVYATTSRFLPQATPLVTSGDIVMAPGAIGTGVVTDAATGQPLPSACAAWQTTAFPGAQSDVRQVDPILGSYRTHPIPAGVGFSQWFRECGAHQNDAFRQCLIAHDGWDDPSCAPLFVQSRYAIVATPVRTATEAERFVLDVALPIGGEIRGRVTDPTGAPLAGIRVTTNPSGLPFEGMAFTDDDGRYRAIGLRAGTYEVRFSNGEAGDRASAGLVTVGLGGVVEGVDAVMPSG